MSSTAMERVVAPERDAAFGSGDDGTKADAEARRARAATTRAIVLVEGAHSVRRDDPYRVALWGALSRALGVRREASRTFSRHLNEL